MKFYFLGTIGGITNPEYAGCIQADANDFYTQNSLEWWKWGRSCPNCGVSTGVPVEPYQMRWIEGSEQIGDFVGSGIHCSVLLAQQKVVDYFMQNDYFANYKDVSFMSQSFSPRSKNIKYPVVSSPYLGSKFSVVSPRYGIHLNEDKSHIVRKSRCSVCGLIQYDMCKTNDFWSNLVIDEEEWNGLKMFGLFEFNKFFLPSTRVFLSEGGYDLLKKQGFTNWQCQEVGRIEKAGTGHMLPYREKTEYPWWKPEEFVKKTKKKGSHCPRVSKRTKKQ